MKHSVLFASCLTMTALAVFAQDAPPPKDQPPPPPPPPAVPLPVLIDAAQTALATCAAAGWHVGVTVVDADLTTRLSLRDDGAGSGAVEVSRRKAYTAAKMGMSSDDYAKSLAPEDIVTPPPPPGSTRSGEPSVRNADPQLLPKAGGVPIIVKGKLVGAMGVSGRPAGKDVECVNAGLARIAAAVK
jgi:glc operon protein GlcG